MSVDTLTTMEQVEASTDDSKAVGAGAVKELSSSLTYYDEETSTLYIKGGSGQYSYDSDTETLYLI